jgi:hypothetical protein
MIDLLKASSSMFAPAWLSIGSPPPQYEVRHASGPTLDVSNTARGKIMSESERDERIRQRAYERYEQRGREDGRDFEDWLESEREENELFESTKYPPLDQPEAPDRDDVGTQPGSTDDAATGGAPGRGTESDRVPPQSAPSHNGEAQQKDDKINQAAKESFPASDAPAWRGGTAD